MTLSEQLFLMMQNNQEAMQLTDVAAGTVTGVDPLEITINTSMAPLRAEVLYLTHAVVERKLPVLAHDHSTGGLDHTHTTSAGSTGSSLSGDYVSSQSLVNVAALEDGKPLPVRGGYIILNRGLEEGDRVLLLRVEHGQKYIVLSRIYE